MDIRYLPRQRLFEDAELDEEGHEVSARDVLHHKVQAIPVLKHDDQLGRSKLFYTVPTVPTLD